MVKGVTRQVIVVQSPDRKLFEQAIFILRDDIQRQEITDEMLLKEAKQASGGKGRPGEAGPVWACGGALATGLLWLLSALISLA